MYNIKIKYVIDMEKERFINIENCCCKCKKYMKYL